MIWRMNALLAYLKSLPMPEQASFAQRCGTTVGYLRKAISVGSALREGLCIRIERESGGAVRLEQLRPDVDWNYLRDRVVPGERQEDPQEKPSPALTHQAPAAINSVQGAAASAG